MYATSSSSVKFHSYEDAAQACRFWPNPPPDVMTRCVNNVDNIAPITQLQIDTSATWRERECGAVRLSSQGWYWLMYDDGSRTASATDTSYTRGTDFASCGDNPPPPSPAAPPPPSMPPNQPAACGALAPWWTYRSTVTKVSKSKRAQCLGIPEWFCAKGNGREGLNNNWVYQVYCKNADGDIVYCESRYGSPTCEGEATCTGFTPTCDGSKRHFDCENDVGTNNGIGSFNGDYQDSGGKPNCLQKYGVLYEDFVGTCMGAFHPLASHNDPLTATQHRSCNLDSNVDGFRAVRENLVDMSDGSEEFVDATLSVYRDGYRNNHHHFWFDDLTGGTGLTKQNYGWGENFYSTSPYWTTCNKESTTARYIKCSDDPTFVASAAVAAGASFERLGEKIGLWKRRLAEASRAAWAKYFPEKIRKEEGDALYGGVHKTAAERRKEKRDRERDTGAGKTSGDV